MNDGNVYFAGPIELSTGDIALILAIMAVIGLVLMMTGGIVALSIGGTRRAFLLGCVTFAVVAWGTGAVVGRFDVAVLAGWLASGAVGAVVRSSGKPRSTKDPSE